VNITGVEYAQISIFLSSVFAVIGVALFAQWSILSSVNASMIIFFGFPYHGGDKIRIIDLKKTSQASSKRSLCFMS
jgi:hypothetical protein